MSSYRFSKTETKSSYKELLNETIELVENVIKMEENELYNLILGELLDLRQNVVELEVLTEWDEINQRYTLGGIAIKNFEEKEEMYNRLIDIFYGATIYQELEN